MASGGARGLGSGIGAADGPPNAIRLLKKEKRLELIYASGAKVSLPAELLRVCSPSADTRRVMAGTGRERVVSGRRHVGIMSVEAVGNYAIRIHFDDLHSSGIFTWDYLAHLGGPGRVLELLRVLDEGAYGVIVAARHRVIYQTMREVRVLQGLPPHPNIVQLKEAFQSEAGHVYLAFELAHGGLHKEAARLPGHALPTPTLKAVAWQLLRALGHCHAHGIVHRDVKPANVLTCSPIAAATAAAADRPSKATDPRVAGSPGQRPDGARNNGGGGGGQGVQEAQMHLQLQDATSGAFSVSPSVAAGGGGSIGGGTAAANQLLPVEHLDSFECGDDGTMLASPPPTMAAPSQKAEAGAAAPAETGAPASAAAPAATAFPLVKLCDFGFARAVQRSSDPWYDKHMTSYVVTRFYRAPEILTGAPYGMAIDVWSFGCTLAELATGRPLFPGRSCMDQLWRITRCLGPLPASQLEAMHRDLRLAPMAAEAARPLPADDAGAPSTSSGAGSVPPSGAGAPAGGDGAAAAARLGGAASELRTGPLGTGGGARCGGAGGAGSRLWRDSACEDSGGSALATALQGVEPRLMHLIAACLTLDPDRRPTVQQLLQMPYFWDVDSLLAGTQLEHLLDQPAPAAAAAPLAQRWRRAASGRNGLGCRGDAEATGPVCAVAAAAAWHGKRTASSHRHCYPEPGRMRDDDVPSVTVSRMLGGGGVAYERIRGAVSLPATSGGCGPASIPIPAPAPAPDAAVAAGGAVATAPASCRDSADRDAEPAAPEAAGAAAPAAAAADDTDGTAAVTVPELADGAPTQYVLFTPFSTDGASSSIKTAPTAPTAAAVAAASSPTAASCTTQYSGRTWVLSDDGVTSSSCRGGRRPESGKLGWGAVPRTGTHSFVSGTTRQSLDSNGGTAPAGAQTPATRRAPPPAPSPAPTEL
ncbi:hypothetical protein GPECTOR_51g689 [Gonium pectorale]|uniref:Protein kinase domain-containing protein n=1 Tax=Gonium pectorale TaxID=33097 RepID=A0A150G787_GONPE|nr:hypothetical protein GPECTOR_51g689 [Gonium pectorale]|eukprot:KXZ45704.1 hypothetical protein GPECTOR_51g689 [Gonium pectorale]